MRMVFVLLAGTVLSASAPALASDQLKFGKIPDWVVPQSLPATTSKSPGAPVSVLLTDQQVHFEPGKITTYAEVAMKLQTAEGLSAGNVSLRWNPATDTVTVNKLVIRRGSQVIDVLASGQRFTTMRRESNLELAMLDGMLTATLQPDGLQEGDIVDLVTTTEHVDPVLGDHVEATFGEWDRSPVGLAHVRVDWPASKPMTVHASGGLPNPTPTLEGGRKLVEMTAHDVEPSIPPKGAPARFRVGRLGEATDFASWADVAKLMMPLFRDAEAVNGKGPLHDEIEKIRATSPDPRLRAALALQLVQQRVRYVALLMGQGSYVPAKAEDTWSRRFGDCKAKTALLLGILHALGIEAEPILVQSKMGDAIADRLPLLSYFDHVLVRAHLAGKTYYLDGTRTGDTTLDDIEVPSFGWGLPLIGGAKLVQLVPEPRRSPDTLIAIDVDASAGIVAPAKIRIDETYHGDTAVAFNAIYAQLTAAQREQMISEAVKGYFDGFSLATSQFKFDKDKRDFNVEIGGTAKLNWKDSWYYVPAVSIAYKPDFDRPAGPMHDVPMATNYPSFSSTRVALHLPPGFAAQQKLPVPVKETVAGVEYSRFAKVTGNDLVILASERTTAPEISYKEALAAAPRLKALDSDDVYLRGLDSYKPTKDDIASIIATPPGAAWEYVRRASVFLDAHKYDEAIADFSQAISLDPKDSYALSGRGFGHIYKREFDSAEKDLAAAEAIDPRNASVLRGRGLMAEMQEDCAKAVEFFTRSIALDASTFALGHRATCEAELGKDAEAMADSAEVLKSSPSWMDLRILRANIGMRQGKHDVVLAEAEALTRDNPGADYAWVGASKIYSALGQRQRAMAALDRALAIKKEAYVYVNRSLVRPRSDTEGRIADLDAALKLEPDNQDALSLKSSLLADSGKYEEALALLDRTKADPDDRYRNQQRAILLSKSGKVAEAQKLFQSIRSSANTASALNSLCWAKATAGVMLDSALQDCRDALKLKPDSGSYLDSLGMTLLKLGRLDEALVAYDQAVAKNTGANSLMGRAFVHARKGDQARAQADAAAARKLYADIDDTFAQYGLTFTAMAATGGPAAAKTAAGKNN